MHRIDRLWQEAGETAKVLNPRFYPGTAFLQRVRAGREAARVCVRRAGAASAFDLDVASSVLKALLPQAYPRQILPLYLDSVGVEERRRARELVFLTPIR